MGLAGQDLKTTDDGNKRLEKIALVLERTKRFLVVVDRWYPTFGVLQDGGTATNNKFDMTYYGMMVVECAYEAELLAAEDLCYR